MANHYHRQSQTRSRARKRNHRSFTWLWVLFGMLIGVGGTAIGYVLLTNLSSSSLVAQAKPKVQKIAKKEKEKESAQRFEFYTLLPGMEIQLPDSTPVAAKAQEKPAESVQVMVQPQASPLPPAPPPIHIQAKPHPVPTQPSKSTAAQYIVQAGIFQDLEHADELKAKLTLQGFNTKIQKVQTQEGQTWFRVTLGPFISESLALSQKKRLEGQKIHGILILQRPNS